jgi:hypothetical protein
VLTAFGDGCAVSGANRSMPGGGTFSGPFGVNMGVELARRKAIKSKGAVGGGGDRSIFTLD